MSLRLKSGKFYDDAGNVVPLEFGNKEQYAILDRVRKAQDVGESLMLDFWGDGIYHARVGLVCVCGEPLFFNLAEDMDHVKKTCGCGLTWRTEEDGEIEIIAKIVIKK